MDSALPAPLKPRLREQVDLRALDDRAELSIAGRTCAFAYAEGERDSVSTFLQDLRRGGFAPDELERRNPAIAGHVPQLLADLNRLRLVEETDPAPAEGARSGEQLYRDVRRAADRTFARSARSSFYHALVDASATRSVLVGYALEYFWLVKAAPGLIAPALASAYEPEERKLLQDFLRSELGHDAFLGKALDSVGVGKRDRELHQPLTTTFALGASLGVYARQHPLSFCAVLFLFERAQPAFVDAFDRHCETLGLPDKFHGPLRRHADLNDDYDHGDISRELLALRGAVSAEECAAVKRHVVLMAETMVAQEEQILSFYADRAEPVARIFE